jgi:hypothetical protein
LNGQIKLQGLNLDLVGTLSIEEWAAAVVVLGMRGR